MLDAFWWTVYWVSENFRPKYKIFRLFSSSLPCFANKKHHKFATLQNTNKSNQNSRLSIGNFNQIIDRKHLCISQVNYIISAKYKLSLIMRTSSTKEITNSQGNLTMIFHFCSNPYCNKGTIQSAIVLRASLDKSYNQNYTCANVNDLCKVGTTDQWGVRGEMA